MMTQRKWGFTYISDRYTINFPELVYEIAFQSELWIVIFTIESGKTNWHIWSDDPTKMRILSLFQFAKRLNSYNQ